MSSPVLAHVISRRPDLVGQAVARALDFSDQVIVGLHGITFDGPGIHVSGDDYVTLTNDVFAACAEIAPASLRLDDDDFYPDDYPDIYGLWQPGHMVWGSTLLTGCDGTVLKRHHNMSAGVIPSDLTVWADQSGRIAESIRQHTEPIYVDTGVIKTICPGRWSWAARVPYAHRIACIHGHPE